MVLLARLLEEGIRGTKRYFSRIFKPRPVTGKAAGHPKVKYSDLTPYEIEDADYEDIHPKRD